MLSSPPRDFPSGALDVERNLVVPGSHFRNTLYTLTGTRLVPWRLPRDHEKDHYSDVLSLSSASWRAFLFFRSRPLRYPPFLFNYTTEAMIDTRLIVFMQKPLHASWYLMSTTKCSTLQAKCPHIYVRVHAYVRLNNDDCSRMYVLAMADLCARFVLQPVRNAIKRIKFVFNITAKYFFYHFSRILMKFYNSHYNCNELFSSFILVSTNVIGLWAKFLHLTFLSVYKYIFIYVCI